MITEVKKRHGDIVPFDKERIATAIKKAFIASNTNLNIKFIKKLTDEICSKINDLDDHCIHVEHIQDLVEKTLTKYGEFGAYNALREYILYRESRAVLRKKLEGKKIKLKNGNHVEFTTKILDEITISLKKNCERFNINPDPIIDQFIVKNIPNTITINDAHDALILITREKIEIDPNYSFIASGLLLDVIKREVSHHLQIDDNYFENYINFGIENGFFSEKLATFDLEKLGKSLVFERDLQFRYLGIQTLYDRYLFHFNGTRFELPQALFMRVAMGLALNEDDKNRRAIEFYDELSQFNLMCSTPTLFNAGTVRPQLSSCYVSTVTDSAEGITKTVADNALLSKYAGGIGNDWSAVRAMGAHIKGTNGKSQGVIPFMKMAEATLTAFNQCLHPDTGIYILNNNKINLKMIKDVVVGDKVLSLNGEFNNVIKTFCYNGKNHNNNRKITLASGRELIITGNHHVYCVRTHVLPDTIDGEQIDSMLNRDELIFEWIPANDVQPNDMVVKNVMPYNKELGYNYDYDIEEDEMPLSSIDELSWLTTIDCWNSPYLLIRVIANEPYEYMEKVYDLQVENDPSYTTSACIVHNSGKRRGSGCAYLETWHLDIEEFLELRKNTGDHRRRTHDMNTANWIEDEFMLRVHDNAQWTLFSPDEVPDLHDLYGKAFSERYAHYEKMADEGKIKLFKRISAVELWRKMLTMLFETGHPWVCYKTPCNIRNPQQHVGVVHSSNLCCISGDQRVVTDKGLLTVKELYDIGCDNKVLGLDGVYNASKMLLPRPNAPMVKIHTKEGYSHKVTPDHKVWVKDQGWVEAQYLVEGDKLLIQQTDGMFGQENHADLAYITGLIAGDGTFFDNSVRIDIWDKLFSELPIIRNCLLSIFRTYHVDNMNNFILNREKTKYSFNSYSLAKLLNQYGFNANTKMQVPEFVWKGNKETISMYLRGLYQTDGCLQSSGEATTISLSSISRKLLEDVQILWANLGVKTTLTYLRNESEEKYLPDGHGNLKLYMCQPIDRLLITSIRGCAIADKIIKLSEIRQSEASSIFRKNILKKGYKQKMYCSFSHLEQLPNEDAYCLTVDSDTHAWTVNGFVTKNTEIIENTSENEVAVCNLLSINLANHIVNGELDRDKLANTVKTGMRMLDNVIDINFYPIPEARNSNLKHRPVGLGIMGLQDALYKQYIPFDSNDAVEFSNSIMELISFNAIYASAQLALERGAYETFEGSLWSRGILPIDSIGLLKEVRGEYLEMDTKSTLDWNWLRELVKTVGMRNSNCMAIAPTATISNICGVSQSIEPCYQNLFIKTNLSGDFMVINPYLVNDLKALGLWGLEMTNRLKKSDGSIQNIDMIPNHIKRMYKQAFEIDPIWIVKAASRRQKWIDQSQSVNLYMLEPSGRDIDNLFKLAWVLGLKTTYYLRTMGATHVQKNTVQMEQNQCLIDDPSCESCQ